MVKIFVYKKYGVNVYAGRIPNTDFCDWTIDLKFLAG